MPATVSKPKSSTRTAPSKPKSARARGGSAAAAPGKPAQTGTSTERQPSGERHQNEGPGRRLTAAFEALEAYPALAESRNRLLAVASKEHVATADIVTAVESDVALIIAVLRLANRVPGGRGRVDTVARGVELLTAPAVEALAGRVGTFNFFE